MNVLVTRPNTRGQELVELLNQQQIFALHQPLFTLEAGRELPIGFTFAFFTAKCGRLCLCCVKKCD